jgi:hypothetical protein
MSADSLMVKLSHHDYRFWCANGAFHHQTAVLALIGYHHLCTNLLTYDYPNLYLSSGEGAAVLHTAWVAAGQYAAASRRLGQHVCSGADRSHLIEEGIVEGSFSTNGLTMMRPLKRQNIEDQTTRASVRGS